ncbi:hypothetical protein PYW07_002501 [Mythimna separata]|uniref:FP protein C-terminal domain-containing protein n=1 Tax=Mythimna separata TaxID=271217 RepID=A0AAD7YMD8_MYTSE|nr:hypothetical protein PYW07_002501 [Mythimna separata]
MPLQQSPTSTATAPAAAPVLGSKLSEVCVPEAYESDTASERSCRRNVSVRHKRGHGDDDIKELKGLISSLSSKVDQSFLELKQKNEELKESLQFMSDKYDLIFKSLQNIQEDRAEDKKTIQKLEEKIEGLERKSRLSSLEIRNVPICLRDGRKSESKEDASLIVKTLAKAVEVDIQDCDIKDLYRIQTHKEGNKPIIVELNSVLKKDKIMQGVRNFNKNKSNEEKLNTGHLNIPGSVKPVFISDALTPNTQKLFHAARQFAKENGYTYCWTSRGSVFLRKIEGEPQIRIESLTNLKLLAKK